MKKRLLILFVTLLLSACLLAGCGEDKDGSSKTEAAKETVSQSATTAATSASRDRCIGKRLFFLQLAV